MLCSDFVTKSDEEQEKIVKAAPNIKLVVNSRSLVAINYLLETDNLNIAELEARITGNIYLGYYEGLIQKALFEYYLRCGKTIHPTKLIYRPLLSAIYCKNKGIAWDIRNLREIRAIYRFMILCPLEYVIVRIPPYTQKDYWESLLALLPDHYGQLSSFSKIKMLTNLTCELENIAKIGIYEQNPHDTKMVYDYFQTIFPSSIWTYDDNSPFLHDQLKVDRELNDIRFFWQVVRRRVRSKIRFTDYTLTYGSYGWEFSMEKIISGNSDVVFSPHVFLLLLRKIFIHNRSREITKDDVAQVLNNYPDSIMIFDINWYCESIKPPIFTLEAYIYVRQFVRTLTKEQIYNFNLRDDLLDYWGYFKQPIRDNEHRKQLILEFQDYRKTFNIEDRFISHLPLGIQLDLIYPYQDYILGQITATRDINVFEEFIKNDTKKLYQKKFIDKVAQFCSFNMSVQILLLILENIFNSLETSDDLIKFLELPCICNPERMVSIDVTKIIDRPNPSINKLFAQKEFIELTFLSERNTKKDRTPHLWCFAIIPDLRRFELDLARLHKISHFKRLTTHLLKIYGN
nr:hypothetical protein [Abalone asfa-like virus]